MPAALSGTPKEYEQTEVNQVRRDPEKAHYDVATIRDIIRESHFVNVAFVDPDGDPQCIPMVSAIEEDDAHNLFVYLHGYHRARLVKLLPPETRVCITATLLDGVVLALSAFASSINHRSAVLHGEVLPWDDASDAAYDEKWEAARQIVESVCPGRWDGCRRPTKAEMTTTGFLKVKVLSASAKCRAGEPGEETRDARDAALLDSTWCGVIPTKLVLGPPEPSSINRASIPEHVTRFVASTTAPSN